DSCCLLAANAASSRGERRVHCALPVLLIFLALCSRSAEVDQKPRDLTELTLEELMELEPKVYGASKFEQKATEAPSSVTVIPSDVIKRYGYRTLADILQSVWRSEEHTSELQSRFDLVCRLLLEKKKAHADGWFIVFDTLTLAITTILKRRGCLTVPRLTLMSLIKMLLVIVSVAAISKTFGLLRFILRLSFLAK